MRRRLMLAFVGLVLGVLVIAGAGSVILTDNAARTQATQQLATEAKSLTGHTFPLSTLKIMRRLLHLEDARLIRVSAQGLIFGTIPAGLTSADLMPQSLLNGDSVSGQDGSLAFAAAPVTLTPGRACPTQAQGTGRRRPHPRRERRRPGLGLLLHCGRGGAPDRGAGGMVAQSPDVTSAGRGKGRHGAYRGGGPPEQGAPAGARLLPSRPRWRARSTRWLKASKTRGAGSVSCCWPSRTTCGRR